MRKKRSYQKHSHSTKEIKEVVAQLRQNAAVGIAVVAADNNNACVQCRVYSPAGGVLQTVGFSQRNWRDYPDKQKGIDIATGRALKNMAIKLLDGGLVDMPVEKKSEVKSLTAPKKSYTLIAPESKNFEVAA